MGKKEWKLCTYPLLVMVLRRQKGMKDAAGKKDCVSACLVSKGKSLLRTHNNTSRAQLKLSAVSWSSSACDRFRLNWRES